MRAFQSDHSDGFWAPQSVEKLAEAQGITTPQRLELLTGAAADLWESDEAFDQFLASIQARESTPLDYRNRT